MKSTMLFSVVIHFNFTYAVAVFKGGCYRFALLLLSSFRESVVTFSAAVVKIGCGVVGMLLFVDIEKEPPESLCFPKTLEFKLFSHFDNSIFSYHFLSLHFRIDINEPPLRVLHYFFTVTTHLCVVAVDLILAVRADSAVRRHIQRSVLVLPGCKQGVSRNFRYHVRRCHGRLHTLCPTVHSMSCRLSI